jgi:benzoyl-CoA 2,3-dioxygenase component A
MAAADSNTRIARQHLIDPEICIRCNTCEASCPTGAITHNERNYVVKFDVCNACGACISPCPTGAIDNWRHVPSARAYTIDEQLTWDSLPLQENLQVGSADDVPAEVTRITALATAGEGGIAKAPASAARPAVNLFGINNPAVATVTGNLRLTGPGATSDIRHIVLDFGATAFPVLEGQSIGILPPGCDAQGKPHHVRLYSVASPRNGERPSYNNLSLTVKRVTHDHEGRPTAGIASNYLCDLQTGDMVNLVGPYGATFLMPNHAGASLLMICTGTGSAPMRAMTEWRRRRVALAEGGELLLFFGARTPEELPYFGPLMKLPKSFIDVNLAFSRVPGQPKRYVQDLIRQRSDAVIRHLLDQNSYVYVCGLKGMEQGVEQAFQQLCSEHGVDWGALRPELLQQSRFHVETY